MTDSIEWPLNRPVSAHLTIHYRDDIDENNNNKNIEHKVVKTVLNIDTDSLEESITPKEFDGSDGTCSPLNTREPSRRSSDGSVGYGHSQANANIHYGYGPCGYRPDFGNNKFVARRFSEPNMPAAERSPFVRSSSYEDKFWGLHTDRNSGEDSPGGNERCHRRRNSIAVKFHKASYRKTE